MEAEDRISEVEDRMLEINEAERGKKKRNEDNLRRQKKKKKKKSHEKILEEIIVENVTKMRKEIVTKVQETQRVPKG